MRAIDAIRRPGNRLDIVGGLVDGILNALTLAAGHLAASGGRGATFDLALRVSAAAGATTVFVFFVAHYAEVRLELIRYERQLNVIEHGRLAATSLGRKVLAESFGKAFLAAGCSVLGALFPLVLATLLPSPAWLGLGITIAALGVLGALLARTVYASPLAWSVALLIGGAVLTWVGVQLDLVG